MGNVTVGNNILKLHSLPANDNWYWIGVGVLWLYAFLFNFIVGFALAYLNRKYEICCNLLLNVIIKKNTS